MARVLTCNAAKEIVELVHAHNRVARAREEVTALDRDEEHFRAFVSHAVHDVDHILAVRPDLGTWWCRHGLGQRFSWNVTTNVCTRTQAATSTGPEAHARICSWRDSTTFSSTGPAAHGKETLPPFDLM